MLHNLIMLYYIGLCFQGQMSVLFAGPEEVICHVGNDSIKGVSGKGI